MFVFFAALTCLMVMVIYLDGTRYIIPNWLNGSIALLYVAMVVLYPQDIDWLRALIGAAIVLVLGYIIFLLRWMGGGDIKLFTVNALWVGHALLPEYVILVGLIGGAMSLAVLVARRWAPAVYARKEGRIPPRILQVDEPLPYGLAISSAFLYFLWTAQIPGITLK